MLAVAAVAVLGMMSNGAEAAKRKPRVVVTPYTWWNFWDVRDPKLRASNFVVGAGAAGASYAITRNYRTNGSGLPSGAAYVGTSIGCAAVSPIAGTLYVGRQLSLREVWVSTSNCFLPFVGGWMANAYFDRHPEWDLAPGQTKK
jgi:hypothetical protein